jgi:hypothetical protein
VVAGDEVEREDIGRDGVLRERRGAALAAAAPPGERAGEAGADEDDEDDADAEAEQRQHRARRRAVRHHRCLCLGFSEKEEPAASRAEPSREVLFMEGKGGRLCRRGRALALPNPTCGALPFSAAQLRRGERELWWCVAMASRGVDGNRGTAVVERNPIYRLQYRAAAADLPNGPC